MLNKAAALPFTGVSAQSLAVMYNNLAMLTHAGVTLDAALEQTAGTSPFNLRLPLLSLCAHVRNGSPMSGAMTQFRSVFHNAAVAIVAAGERTGDVEGSFRLLSSFCEKEAALIRTIRSAMLYPTIVVVTAILAVFVLSYTPLMDSTWAIRLLWLLGAAILLWLLLRFRGIQQLARYVSMLIPVFGTIMQQLSVARFCHTLGSLIRAGVPYLEALESTRSAVQHPLVSRATDHVYYSVRNGNTIESAIRSQPVFPAVVHNLVGAGEASGTLDESLLKSAEYIQADAEYKIKNSAKVGGVMLFLVVAVIIGLIIITFWKNYFDLVLSFGEY